MPTVTVDGQEIELGDDERLNGIQVARRAGVEIPHYCWHAGLTVVASCRMCLVESGRKDRESGEISMIPKLVPACQTPAADGTVFVTNSEKVKSARSMVEEDLLIRHPIDCPVCDKAGECSLQDYHFQHGQGQRRADIKPFTSRRRPMGDTVTLFVDRCVMCTRCVRFTREISGTSELMVINRGDHEEIDVFPGFPLDNKMSGNVVDLCPVGALGDKDFLYSQRVWFMKQHDHVCAGCSTGCSIHVEENHDHVYRLKPRENPHINHWWMCDEGRYGYKHIHDPGRVTQPTRRDETGEMVSADWSDLNQRIDSSLRSGLDNGGLDNGGLENGGLDNGGLRDNGKLAAVLSPYLTVEEAYLLSDYIRGLDPDAALVLGPIPIEGTDETYPGNFTIRAEKCPNRNGVEAVISALSGRLLTFDEFLDQISDGSCGGVWITGGYKTDWISDEQAMKLAKIPTIVLQEMFASPLSDHASYRLGALTFAEREGSYVNVGDRLQSFRWAIRPPAGVMPDGQLYWQLSGRAGMFQAAEVLAEVADSIPYFHAAAGEIPDVGVDLKITRLASVEG